MHLVILLRSVSSNSPVRKVEECEEEEKEEQKTEGKKK